MSGSRWESSERELSRRAGEAGEEKWPGGWASPPSFLQMAGVLQLHTPVQGGRGRAGMGQGLGGQEAAGWTEREKSSLEVKCQPA